MTTVAESTGILKFVGAVELGRSRQKKCSIPSNLPSYVIATVTVVVVVPTGNMIGIAFAFVIPVKSFPAAANEGKEKTRKRGEGSIPSVEVSVA